MIEEIKATVLERRKAERKRELPTTTVKIPWAGTEISSFPFLAKLQEPRKPCKLDRNGDPTKLLPQSHHATYIL